MWFVGVRRVEPISTAQSGNYGDDVSFVRQRLGSDLGHQHPVLSGFAALAAVTVSVAMVLALATIFGARLLGISGGGGGGSNGAPGSGPTLYVPDPEPTESTSADEAGAPEESGAPSPGSEASVVPPEPSASATPDAPPIVLTASPSQVGSFERINLTGSFPTGDGSILQVQRKESGRWVDFAVTASVQGGDFATYVQTSRPGTNVWRMKDTDSGAVSNVVRVQVG